MYLYAWFLLFYVMRGSVLSRVRKKINVNDLILSLNYSSFFLTEMRPEDPETKSRWNKS